MGNVFIHLLFFLMRRPPWREDGSVIYSYHCYWALPVLTLSVASPTGLVTISYCLIWQWFPFCRLLRLAWLWWIHSNPSRCRLLGPEASPPPPHVPVPTQDEQQAVAGFSFRVPRSMMRTLKGLKLASLKWNESRVGFETFPHPFLPPREC
jgi:hypothetical protein